jgi:hypothetical protein
MKMLFRLFALSLIAWSSLATAEREGSFPGIEALMTPEEYRAAGMDKLSEAEREALNRFLIRYTAEDSEVMRNTDEEVIEAVEVQEILSAVKPPFKGWSGETVFQLENGQVWQQRRRGNYRHTGDDTRVRITRNFLGFHRLEVLSTGKAVQVKRLK